MNLHHPRFDTLGVGLKRSAWQRAISRGLVAMHLLPHIGVAHEWDKPGNCRGGVGELAARDGESQPGAITRMGHLVQSCVYAGSDVIALICRSRER